MSALAHLSPQTIDALKRARRRYVPRERLSTAQWAERYRYLSGGNMPGKFRFAGQPALRGILEAFDDPAVRELWAMKSAQFGFTQGVEINVIGRRIHLDPSPILVIFPKDTSGKRFMREKLVPEIEATPELRALVETTKRGPDNAQDYKRFQGGFIQLLGANSPANLKSTDAPLVIVEEPDDTARNVRGQGNAIVVARERLKSYGDAGKLLVGGTGTIRGLSNVEAGLEKTDKRRYYVDCPHCGHRQTLRWERVRWRKDAMTSHAVYGTHLPQSAVYACEACVTDDDDFTSPGCWTDAAKNRAIAEAAQRADYGWIATAPFSGKAGFYITELISVHVGSRLEILVTKFLEAQHALQRGDDSLMRSFINNQLGETWEIRSDAPEVQVLRDRAEDYAMWTVPDGGLVVAGAVDVQRGGESGEPRLEYKLKAWGRGMESWLIAYGTVPGNPLEPSTWAELDKVLATPIRHACGTLIGISAMSIDSSDGMTQEAVYRYVRSKSRALNYRAIKGSTNPHKEIFTPPSTSIDTNAMDKAAKWGLKLYWVGGEKAKDVIAGRLQLTGNGPGRMHFCAGLGDAYFAGLTAEVKMPGRNGRMVWTHKAGIANEPLDLEQYTLHAAHSLRLHTYTELDWATVEQRVRQGSLLESPAQRDAPVTIGGDGTRGTSDAPARPFSGFGGSRRL